MIFRWWRKWRRCDHWCWDKGSVWDALCSGFKQGLDLRAHHWPSDSGARLSDQLKVRSLTCTVRRPFFFRIVLSLLAPLSLELDAFMSVFIMPSGALFLCLQLFPIRQWGGSVLQTHLCCSPGSVGQLQQNDWTDRGLHFSAAGRTGNLRHGDHVQHWAGKRAVFFPLHQR